MSALAVRQGYAIPAMPFSWLSEKGIYLYLFCLSQCFWAMADCVRLWIAVAPPQQEELRVLRRLSPDIFTARIDMSANDLPLGRERVMCSGARPIASSSIASSRWRFQLWVISTRWKQRFWRRFQEESSGGMDFFSRKNVMNKGDCSIGSLSKGWSMSQSIDVLIATEM